MGCLGPCFSGCLVGTREKTVGQLREELYVSVLVLVDVWWVQGLSPAETEKVYSVSVLVLVDVWWVQLNFFGEDLRNTRSRSLF